MRRLRMFLANVAKPVFLYPQATPPMGILNLASYVRSKLPVDVQVVNQRQEVCSIEELSRRVIDFKADIVGFGTLSPGGYLIKPLTKLVRDSLPEALIVLGGPHVTASRQQALEDSYADAAVAGEGELSLEAVIRERFEGNNDFSTIPGLMWRTPDGGITTNPGEAPVIEDLDAVPPPAYDLIDLPKYWNSISFTPIPHRKYVALFTSRGCPYGCTYCQHTLGRRYRLQSAARIVDDIEQYIKTYGIDTVEILDDVFNADRKRVMEFCALVRRKGLKFKFTFPNGVRSDIFTQDMINAMADAGMDQITFALESGSPRIQQAMGKRLDIDRFLQSVEWAVNRGVFTQGYCMLGFPTETAAEMQQTIDVCCNTRLHTASFFTVTPLPGTPMYETVLRTMPERLAGFDYRDLEFCNVRMNLSAEPDAVLFGYQRKAQRQFYLNPARLCRIIRDHPRRSMLAHYALHFLLRATKQ